jgi:subfamily B ATP-binding cassette protein MsbA
VALIIYRDSFLAFWALLVFPLAVYPVVHFGKKLRKLGRKQQSQIADISSILQETFSGIRVMKAFAAEEQESAAFRKSNGKLIRLALKGTVYNLLSSPIMEFIGALGAGLVIWYGGSQVIAGNATPGSFFSFMTALIMLYEPFKSISSANNQIQKALAGAERVFDILDSPKIREEQGGQRPFGNEFQALDIDKVSFTYPDAATPALNNIDLHIRAGEKIAIVGSSGSGKTTLANLIPRFFDVKDGEIRLNDTPLRDYRLEELRRSIGIVSQDPFLFNTSVIENIRYGNEHISKDLVEQAARAAYANDFIAELPEKYDTVIGERGVKLSGGQKQRITIARAILKNPSLLILDEATSALDTESERIVQQALENLMQDRTSIVIAHRLSTILSADRIVVMNKGEIVDIGSHDQLLESCSVYRKLYTMQFSEAELNEA